MKIIVVGAGIIGTCIAWRLSVRGHKVVVIDDPAASGFGPSSAGKSRIVRRTYPDLFYSEIMDEAYPMWHELEELADGQLLHETGLLYFGDESSPSLREAESSMRLLNIPFKTINSRSESPRLLSAEVGLLVEDGGWVEADSSLSSIKKIAEAAGATWVTQQLQSPLVGLEADCYILAPGAAILSWVPTLDVTVTRQTYIYQEILHPVEGPVWIHDCPELFYGFPSEPFATSVKVGFHSPGPGIDSEKAPGPEDTLQVSALRRELQERYSELGDTWRSHSCLYTSTSSGDFRIGRHGPDGWFVSACSGHAFKMGPWLGRLLADLVEGKQELAAWPRFAFPPV